MLTFKTNIKCAGCVQKVKPYLDKLPSVREWSVDLNSADKVLNIEGEVEPEQVIHSLSLAGYKAGKING